MKNFKKLFSLLLVVMLLFSTVIMSSADEDPNNADGDSLPTGAITINDKGEEGVYNGYKLINSTNSE